MAYYPFATELGARYALIAPDGTAAIFNDQGDPNYVGMVTDLTGLDSPEVRESAADLVESDGGTHGAFYYGRRPIVISARVFGHDSVAARNFKLDLARRASNALRADATLSWRPSQRLENWLPNPAFENGTTTWSLYQTGGTGALTTQSAVAGVSRANTAQVASTSSALTELGLSLNTANAVPVVPGQSWSANAWVRSAATARNAHAIIGWYTANKTFISSSFGSFVTTASSTWRQTPTVTDVAPATAAYATAYVAFNAITASGEIHYVDAATLAPTANFAAVYQDGTVPGWYWQGVADNSMSANYIEMFTLVRRQQPYRESGAWVKDIQISLVSPNAFLYGTGLKTVANGVAGENRGSSPAYPLITVTGASSNPTISDGTRSLVTTGMSGGSALAAGEVVQFDTLNHTAVFTAGGRNGQSANRYIDYANTRWPYLSPAANTTFTLSGGGSASIQYRDTWV